MGAVKPTESSGLDTSARTTKERSGVYGFLAEVFRAESTPALLRKIREPAFLGKLAAAGVRLGEDFAARPEREFLEELAVEYTRLFLGPGPHVHPYAGVYLSGEGASLCGPEAVWARDFMEEAGFVIAPAQRDLPDHVGIELEFMHKMTEREAQALDRADLAEAASSQRIQKQFLEQHLGRWLPQFCDKAMERAVHPFYRELAGLAKSFLESELAYFSELRKSA